MGENFPFAGGDGLGVDGHDDTLAAELIGGARDHVRIGHGGGVEAYLVGPGKQKSAHIPGAAHAAADRQRDIALLGGAAHDVKHRAAVFMGRVDVEKAKLVGARRIIGAGGIHRVAGIHQIDKVDAFDHAAIGHVEAGYDAGFEHIVAVTVISRRCLWANVVTCQRIRPISFENEGVYNEAFYRGCCGLCGGSSGLCL